jgi:hypothetical protein
MRSRVEQVEAVVRAAGDLVADLAAEAWEAVVLADLAAEAWEAVVLAAGGSAGLVGLAVVGWVEGSVGADWAEVLVAAMVAEGKEDSAATRETELPVELVEEPMAMG